MTANTHASRISSGKELSLCALLIVLAGCQSSPQFTAFKPGTTFSDRQWDADQCKIASLKDIPQSLGSSVVGGYYSPGSLSCSTYGSYTSCNTIGAINVPPRTITYDVNAKLRQRYVNRCMEAKGYRFLEHVPLCETSVSREMALLAPQPDRPEDMACSSGKPLEDEL